MLLSQIVRQRCMGCCCRARWDGAERATHSTAAAAAATGSLNRREMAQKMCNPNILGSCIKFYQLPQLWWPILTFPPVSLPLSHTSLSLSVSSHRSSHGQEPRSPWVQRVPFQSLAAVIFQLARCSPSCQSVTNDRPGPYCTCAAPVRDWEPCIRPGPVSHWAWHFPLTLSGDL